MLNHVTSAYHHLFYVSFGMFLVCVDPTSDDIESAKNEQIHMRPELCAADAQATFRIVRASVLQRWGQLPIAEFPSETRALFRMRSSMCLKDTEFVAP